MERAGDRSEIPDRWRVVQHVTEAGLLPYGPDEMLREVLERVRAGLSAATATIMVLDEAGEQLVVRGSAGLEAEVGLRVPVGSGIAGRVAAEGKPLLVPDLAAAQPYSEVLRSAQLGSMVAVPLTVAAALVGVLNVGSKRRGAFDQADVELMVLLADRVALAVERVRAAEREVEVAAALRATEERARAILETAVDAIITIDRCGLVESMNSAAVCMFGYPVEEVVGRNVSMLMPEPYRSQHDEYIQRYQRTGDARVIGIGREAVAQRRDGTTFPIELAVSELSPEMGLYTGVVRDITERKRLEEQLTERALYDPLTGAGNRALLVARLDQALARLARHSGLLTMLFVDLDRFKQVNDTMGHDVGDALLVQVAKRLKSVVRPEDLVVRLGGDEFVVVCEGFGQEAEVERLVDRVVHALGAPHPLRGREVFVSASVGVTTTGESDRSADELLRDADAAMYHSKEQGPGRYTFFDETMRNSTNDRLLIAGDLRQAIERSELRACYQPLVDLRSGDVHGGEALLRWDRAGRTLLPGEFLDIADEIALSAELDAWMLSTACADAAGWGRRLGRRCSVWVNLCARSLADPALGDMVTRALEASGLEPGLLTLEMTEGALMQDAAATVGVLQGLCELGVRLAVDDFGTGYSSLAYLQRFPVHCLKVDRSFVAPLDDPDTAAGSAAIIRAVVSLARSLGLETVAEGIETPEQLDAVTALGCDLGQGYFLGRPSAEHDLTRAAASGVILPAHFLHEVS